MKRKNLLVSLMAIFVSGALIVSCGGGGDDDNSVGSNTSASNLPGYNSNSSTSDCVAAYNKSDLRSVIANGMFPAEYGTEEFVFQECEIDESSFLGIDFNTVKCDNDTFSRFSTFGQDSIQHEMANTKSALINHLLSRVDNANSFTEYAAVSSYIHQIEDYATGDVWEFNTCLPLASQPTAVYGDNEQYKLIYRFSY